MPATARLTVLCLALLCLPGCATVALNAALRAAHPQPAWNGEVAVASEPPGARCTIGRGDRVLAEVPAAPGTVRLERSHHALEVRCAADGFLETAEVLRARDGPAVFRMAPNGVIGATATVIGLASARTMRFPSEVTVTLVPATFPDEAAREAFFAARRAAVVASRTSLGNRNRPKRGGCMVDPPRLALSWRGDAVGAGRTRPLWLSVRDIPPEEEVT